MKKTFKLEELDCANCAAKMEEQINKLEGVIKASISFMSQKLVLETEEERFEDIVKEVSKLIKKIEPDCRLVLK